LFKTRENFRPFEFERACEFTKTHIENPWHADQISIESDLHSFKTEFTESEQHGISTILKLFTLYEVNVGNFWSDVVYKWFKPYEIRMMASTFAHTEMSIHAVFYDKLNQYLGLDTKEFYLSYKDDENMSDRMKSIGESLKVSNRAQLPVALATFSFIEGVSLFSSFAYLAAFSKRGKLMNIHNGIMYSIREEDVHSMAGSWLFNILMEENKADIGDITQELTEVAENLVDVECGIIDSVFSKGSVKDITSTQLKNFVKSRMDKKLKDIGVGKIYNINYNPVDKWFTAMVSSPALTDFFATNSTSYTHNWDFNKIKEW